MGPNIITLTGHPTKGSKGGSPQRELPTDHGKGSPQRAGGRPPTNGTPDRSPATPPTNGPPPPFPRQITGILPIISDMFRNIWPGIFRYVLIHSDILSDVPGLSDMFQGCFQDFPGFSEVFRDVAGFSGIFRDFPRLSGTSRDFPEFSEIFRDFPIWSWLMGNPGFFLKFLEMWPQGFDFACLVLMFLKCLSRGYCGATAGLWFSMMCSMTAGYVFCTTVSMLWTIGPWGYPRGAMMLHDVVDMMKTHSCYSIVNVNIINVFVS